MVGFSISHMDVWLVIWRYEMATEQIEKVSYSIDEAIEATGIGRTLLFAEIKEGRLGAVKCGKRTLIPVQSLRDWVNSLPSALDVRGSKG